MSVVNKLEEGVAVSGCSDDSCDSIARAFSHETMKMLSGLRSIVNLVGKFGENMYAGRQQKNGSAMAGPRGRAPSQG
jgi:hypothetical protein